MLMQDPEHFVGMWSKINRKLEPDEAIYPYPIRFREIEHSRDRNTLQKPLWRIPFEGYRHQFRCKTTRAQLLDEIFRMNFRTAMNERNLDISYCYTQRKAFRIKLDVGYA